MLSIDLASLALLVQGNAGAATEPDGFVNLFGAQLSNRMEKLQEYLGIAQDWIILNSPRVLAALLVYFVGRWLTRLVVRLLRRAMTGRSFDETLTKFLCNLVGTALTVVVLLAALDLVGVATTSFVAVLGAATLAVGFALQGSLSNFAAGILIIVFRPFRDGDYVEAGGTAGTIEEVSLFATIIITPDNKQIIVPNSAITGGNIVNYSAKPSRRIDFVFSMSYEDDIKKVKGILERILEEEPRVLANPAPMVGVLELADSSVKLACRPWVKTAEYWPAYFELVEKVKLEFDANGITIPFPQHDVRLHQVG